MRLYFEVGRKAFQRSSAYRLTTLTGIVVNSFFGYLYCSIYLGVYAGVNNAPVAGLTAANMVSYLWLTQAIIAPVQIWFNRDIANTIYSGAAVSDFSKPFDYQTFWYSRFLGNSIFSFFFRTLPTYTIGVIFFGASLPKQAATFPLFLLSLILSATLGFLTCYLINITAFWMVNANGAFSIGAGVQMFFSGFIIPIAYMPDWLAAICYALPFQALITVPAKIWLEQEQQLTALLPQIGWIGVLWLLAQQITRLAFRKIVIQGG